MKKLLALLLALMMSISMFAGCGEDETSGGGSDKEESKEEASERVEKEKKEKAKKEVFDKIENSETLSVFANTVKKLAEESDKAYKNVYGLNAKSKEGTMEMSVGVEGLSSLGAPFSNVNISTASSWNLNSDEVVMKATGDIDGKKINAAEMYWDNNNIGFAMPDFTSTTILVPTKDFGKKWNASHWAEETGTTLPEKLDISLGNLTSVLDFGAGVAIKFGNATLDFFEACETNDAGTKKVEFETGEESVDVREMIITDEAVQDYALELIEIVEDLINSSEIAEVLEMFEVGELNLDEDFEEIKNQIETNCVFDPVTVNIWVYDDMVIGVEWDEEFEGQEIYACAYFTDPEYLSDGMYVSVMVNGVEYMYIDNSGNYVKGGSVLENNSVMSVMGMVNAEVSTMFDYASNEYEISLSGDAMGQGIEMGISGSCYKNDGFKITIEEIEFPEMPDEVNMILDMLDISMTIRDKATVKKNAKGGKSLLDMTEADFEELATEIQENAMALAERLGLASY